MVKTPSSVDRIPKESRAAAAALLSASATVLRRDRRPTLDRWGSLETWKMVSALEMPSGKLTVCYWQLPFIVDFPIKNGGSFHSSVSLPEGNGFIQLLKQKTIWELGHSLEVVFFNHTKSPHIGRTLSQGIPKHRTGQISSRPKPVRPKPWESTKWPQQT